MLWLLRCGRLQQEAHCTFDHPTDARAGFGSTFLQSNIVEYLYWPEREVMFHLKARTRGLSLHSMDDFVRMRKDSNFAYKVLKGNTDKIAEQLAKRDGR
jgi:hypothetical protein